jgi:hypothetical protein
VIAVEVHQVVAAAAEVSFQSQLAGRTTTPPPPISAARADRHPPLRRPGGPARRADASRTTFPGNDNSYGPETAFKVERSSRRRNDVTSRSPPRPPNVVPLQRHDGKPGDVVSSIAFRAYEPVPAILGSTNVITVVTPTAVTYVSEYPMDQLHQRHGAPPRAQ